MAKRAVFKGKAQKGSPNQKKQNHQGGGVKKRIFTKTKPKVQDARQKLNQRKRKNMVDARDVLAKMAKTQDARNKLNKLRQKRNGPVNNNNTNIKVIGRNIVQKTDRNGKISLVTNHKTKPTVLNTKVQKELGLGAPPQILRNATFKRALPTQRNAHALRQAVLREIEHPALQLRATYDTNAYKWSKSGGRATASQLIGALDRQQQVKQMRNFAVNRAIASQSQYIDLDEMDDEEMPMVPVKQVISLQGSSRYSNIHSRLDRRTPLEMETHGILGHAKTKVVVPAGHRIVVSNLQSTVTQDDVKELFEDIGQLLAARLVRPGVAEVIYKNLKDAQKAVDTYHNRQLDGQPMKCLLVNKRPLNNPTAPPLAKTEPQGYYMFT